ncbi:hypothetical protein NicSoilB4_02130 [Arthrobacter sp. NicSoilB4]|uniref:YtxH domain-containing protein n=1 Tax=Arthrobacter sp. NicSoilB4 TaxID=2830997 RepID=UPI001CC3B5DB|nr:YtxH domain-containing protein [Arthrobacter sp. NicSoilB4]BCW65450.1 hypothetical protein NicSoilB4_02130 [Arthrobacter sp. NicSoilB4]
MKGKLLFGAGIAAGYVLGSRSGRAAYEKLKARASALWESQPVQDKVAAATDAVKEKAPEVSEKLGEAARRAGTVISSAVHRDASTKGSTGATPAGEGADIPAHSTHPETVNLGTSAATARTSDVDSDPALSDRHGQDWSDEGGATRAGAATNVDPDKAS